MTNAPELSDYNSNCERAGIPPEKRFPELSRFFDLALQAKLSTDALIRPSDETWRAFRQAYAQATSELRLRVADDTSRARYIGILDRIRDIIDNVGDSRELKRLLENLEDMGHGLHWQTRREIESQTLSESSGHTQQVGPGQSADRLARTGQTEIDRPADVRGWSNCESQAIALAAASAKASVVIQNNIDLGEALERALAVSQQRDRDDRLRATQTVPESQDADGSRKPQSPQESQQGEAGQAEGVPQTDSQDAASEADVPESEGEDDPPSSDGPNDDDQVFWWDGREVEGFKDTEWLILCILWKRQSEGWAMSDLDEAFRIEFGWKWGNERRNFQRHQTGIRKCFAMAGFDTPFGLNRNRTKIEWSEPKRLARKRRKSSKKHKPTP